MMTKTSATVLVTVLSMVVADAWLSPLLPRPLLVMTPRSRFLRDFPDGGLVSRDFSQMSPRYEITDNDEKFQIAVNVPTGMKADDLRIHVDDDEHMLAIEGKRESKSDNYEFSSKFSQRFSLDPAVELDKFEASLEKDVLTVSAPKDPKKVEEQRRLIPITETASNKDEPGEDESDESKKETLKVEHIKEGDLQSA